MLTHASVVRAWLRIAAILGAMCGAATARAQQPSLIQPDSTACPTPARDTSGAATAARDSTSSRQDRRDSLATPRQEHAAIVLRASASAREIRFAKQPRIRVRLCGGVLDSVRVLERRNLPDPVQPGTTYRDVYIAVEILGHLNADCLAAKLGVSQRPSPSSDVCASVSVNDSSGARRTQQRPPP